MSLGLAIALGLRRLRGLRRVCWHRLSGRWPRYRWRPMDGPVTLSGWERVAWRRLAASARSRRDAHVASPGPDHYSRKRQQ